MKDSKFSREYQGTPRWAIATKEAPLSYLSMQIYFARDECNEMICVLSQSDFLEKALDKLHQKGVIDSAEPDPIYSLQLSTFQHTYLFQEAANNPQLSREELSILRAGVNTLSYVAGGTQYHLLASLGSVARGQANGRKRHLDALRILLAYAFTHRFSAVSIPIDERAPKVHKTSQLRIHTEADVDASLGRDPTDAKARHGYFIFIGLTRCSLSVVAARTQLQSTVALSTCEAELSALSFSCKAVLGLWNFLSLVFKDASVEIPRIHGDNQAANRVGAAQASVRHLRHLSLPQIWIRELSQAGRLRIYDKRSNQNCADMLTKTLAQQTVDRLWSLMRVVNALRLQSLIL